VPPGVVSADADIPRLGYVATLAQTADCIWASGQEALRDGSRLVPGTLRLRQGVAKIHFDSGPALLIEGPLVLQIHSASAATLVQGKVAFQSDATATPFDLQTPFATMVNFGTE